MNRQDLPIRWLAIGLVLCTLAACGDGTDGSAEAPAAAAAPLPASTPFPGPTSGPHAVEGEVFSFDTGAIAAAVDLWVGLDSGGYSYWWANGRLDSDLAGRFEAPNLPSAQITLLAHHASFEQPCRVSVAVPADQPVRIEMVTVQSLDAFDPPPPQLSGEPWVTGTIYETTADGRRPIPGARLWAENPHELALATTRSNRAGGFLLCRLGEAVWIHVSKNGFEAKWVGPVDGSASQVLEIELLRTAS